MTLIAKPTGERGIGFDATKHLYRYRIIYRYKGRDTDCGKAWGRTAQDALANFRRERQGKNDIGE